MPELEALIEAARALEGSAPERAGSGGTVRIPTHRWRDLRIALWNYDQAVYRAGRDASRQQARDQEQRLLDQMRSPDA